MSIATKPTEADLAEARASMARIGDRPVKFAALDGIVAGLGAAIRQRLAPLEARVAALEAQQAEVLKRGLRFRGAYQRALDYGTGDVVVHQGTPWAAIRATSETPGASQDWQLLVKTAGGK